MYLHFPFDEITYSDYEPYPSLEDAIKEGFLLDIGPFSVVDVRGHPIWIHPMLA